MDNILVALFKSFSLSSKSFGEEGMERIIRSLNGCLHLKVPTSFKYEEEERVVITNERFDLRVRLLISDRRGTYDRERWVGRGLSNHLIKDLLL
jgi:hypothetical protein